MTFRDFAEIGKSAFVEVATEDYGLRGRKTNISRVAMLTGMTRREVKRLRDLLEENRMPKSGTENIATRVLTGWHQDPEFLDAGGAPLILPLNGPGPSLMQLLKRYRGDVPATALLKELQTIKALEKTEDGRYRVLSRSYITKPMDEVRIRQWGVALHDLAGVIAYNTDDERKGDARFERMAVNHFMPIRKVKEFEAVVAQEGQRFLEGMDAWLSENEADTRITDSSERTRLGVGVYFITNS